MIRKIESNHGWNVEPREGIREVSGNTSSLSMSDILALVGGDCCALHVKNFLPEEICIQLMNQVTTSEKLRSHREVDGLKMIGYPFFSVAKDSNREEQYYREAKNFSQDIREMCFPYLSPLDQIISELCCAWQPGVAVEAVNKQSLPMSPGIVRVVEKGVEVLPHHDFLSEDVKNSNNSSSLTCQLGLNVYLDVPEHGGELDLYLRKYSSSEFARLSAGSYGIDRTLVGAPVFSIKPAIGDMILIRTWELHGIRSPKLGRRATMSSFIGVRSENEPITIWA